MKRKSCIRYTQPSFKLISLVLAFFLMFPRLGTAQLLKITEVITWMNESKAQVIGTIKAKQFVYSGDDAGFLEFNLRYSLGTCHLTVEFKNGKLDAISWNEYVGYAGQLRGEAQLNGFGDGEMSGVLYSFKNYERKLVLTLIDHSAAANEIEVTIGRMAEADFKKRNVEGGRQYLGASEFSNGNLKPVNKESEFVGGIQALAQYLQKNLVYPDTAVKKNVEGTVLVQFSVNKDGSVGEVKVISGNELGYGLPEEAIRVVSNMPKWVPAKQGESYITSYKKIPIVFRLSAESAKP
jgi:TonB family protein